MATPPTGPLDSPIQPFYIKKFVGMNNKTEDNELSIEASVISQNLRFETEPGTITKRDPLSYYNGTTMDATHPVISMWRVYTAAGETKLVAQCNTSLYVGADSTGVMTAIRTGLTEGKPINWVVYQNLLIGSNGYDNPFVYDGSSSNVTWELGSCKAVASTGTGITATSISYQVSIDADTFICGAISNTISTVSNKDINLTNIPLGPVGTTNRKIWRKDSGTSGDYKLVTTISNNTATTYTDSTPSGSLGAAIGAVTDDMPVGRLIKNHRERLFIAGNPTYPNRIYYSQPYLPHYIAQTVDTAYLDISPDDNDEIQGIPITLGIMWCIKRNTIRPIHVTTATSGASAESWYADDPSTYIGTPAWRSIVETPYGIYFVTWDHWVRWDGSNATEVIDEFDCGEILPSNYVDTVAHYNNGILYLAYTDVSSGSQDNDKLMLWNFRRNAMSYDIVGVDSFASFSGGDDVNELFYGSSTQGYIYRAINSDLYLKYRKKSEIDNAVFIDSRSLGTEDDPYIEISRDVTINGLTVANEECWDAIGTEWAQNVGATSGTINDLRGTIDMRDTTGTVIFPAVNLSAGTFGKLSWNIRLAHASDTASFYVRSSTTQALCEEQKSITGVTDATGGYIEVTTSTAHGYSNGNMVEIRGTTSYDGVYPVSSVATSTFRVIDTYVSSQTGVSIGPGTNWGTALTSSETIPGATASTWVQVKVDLTANSVSTGSPRIFYSDGFVIKMSYRKGGTLADTAVEFIHEVGDRNFDSAMGDKIYKKITLVYESDGGNLELRWATEYSTATFTIDLSQYPTRWESYFPSTAFGRNINFTLYKNDLNTLKVKEIQGLFTAEPIII